MAVDAYLQWQIVPKLTGLNDAYGGDLTSPWARHVGDVLTMKLTSDFPDGIPPNSLDGTNPAAPRQSTWCELKNIPDGIYEPGKRKMKDHTWIVTLPTGTVLNTITAGEKYRVSKEPDVEMEFLCRYQILKDALHTELPAYTTLINRMFDPDQTHPAVPAIQWAVMRECVYDKHLQQMVLPGDWE